MKKTWIFALMVLGFFSTAVISPANIIASTDRPHDETQINEGQSADGEAANDGDMIYEEPLADEPMIEDEPLTDEEPMIEDESNYDDEADPGDLIYMEEPDAGKI